ncbi:unnamed protein product, partial [Closterium sp. NIES-53]
VPQKFFLHSSNTSHSFLYPHACLYHSLPIPTPLAPHPSCSQLLLILKRRTPSTCSHGEEGGGEEEGEGGGEGEGEGEGDGQGEQ